MELTLYPAQSLRKQVWMRELTPTTLMIGEMLMRLFLQGIHT